ncbi:PDR/VanB family oxidoreductase [Arthrobacter sp. NPDC090010]|uniref:PDR/VanB family oxidoreductase n=1 Tax=Arthrobacter sp. NPDC090010 TaxID=3363942 RepID=UPI003817C43E
MAETLELILAEREELTPYVTRFVLRSPTGATLPGYSAGAHLTLTTPSGEKRSYSLVEAGEQQPTEYTVCVRREDQGRGGSLSMHRHARIGDTLTVSGPHNSFGLEPARRYLLIAGGIGVTPIRSMANELRRNEDAIVDVVYLSRSRDDTAFAEEFEQSGAVVHHSAVQGRFDLWPLLAEPDEDTRVYCCGPQPLIDDLLALTMHWRPSRVHVEDFAGVDALGGRQVPFQAVWEPTGEQITVPAGRSLLHTLRDHGIRVPSSCESGTCGSCRIRLISGEADHRDLVLTEDERSRYMMPCVSRAAGPEVSVAPDGFEDPPH